MDPWTAVLRTVADGISLLPADGIRRVAIDGVDGAGKTVFAAALADQLRGQGATVIGATVDGFHRPRRHRHGRGRDDPEGFFYDSYDYSALRSELLDPLGPRGDRWFRTAAFDHRLDRSVHPPYQRAKAGDVLVVDGIFLHRPELRDVWDLSVFLDVPFSVSFARMAARDGSPADPDHAANRRYRVGQLIYLRQAQPWQHATFVVDYSDLTAPTIDSSPRQPAWLG